MTHIPTAHVFFYATELRNVLRDLEGEIRQTAVMLRQTDARVFETNVNDNSSVNEYVNNEQNDDVSAGKSFSIDADTVVTSLKALQVYVEACDTVIHDRLAHARQQVDLAADLSRSYQKMFPDYPLRHSATAVPLGSNAKDNFSFSSFTTGNNTPVGGKICHDEVKHYLSRFVHWDLPEVDRVTFTASTVANETDQFSTLTDGKLGRVEGELARFSTNQCESFLPYDSTQASLHTFAEERTVRRTLNAVMDNLVLRQLQYDGVALSTSMEMNLGCYDRMTPRATVSAHTLAAEYDVVILQEVRCGITQPLVKYNKEGDFIEMVQKAYPRTVQWLAKIAAQCGIPAIATVDGMNSNDVLATLSALVSDTSPVGEASEDSVDNDNSAEPFFLAEAASRESRQEEEERAEDNTAAAVHNFSLGAAGSRLPQQRRDWLPLTGSTIAAMLYVEEEAFVSDADEFLHYQAMRDEEEGVVARANVTRVIADSLTYTDEDVEIEEEERVEVGREEGEREEEEEEGELVDDDDVEVNERASINRLYLDEYSGTEKQQDEGEEQGRTIVVKPTQEKGEKLKTTVIERVKAILSDLLIVCALQFLSQIVSQGKDELTSATMRKASEFTFLLRQHPLVVWRVAVERESQKAKGNESYDIKQQGDTRKPPSLLLAFRHIFVALGYLPLVLKASYKRQKGQDVKMETGEKSEKDSGASALCAQEQLLACVAPFLHLWRGGNLNNLDQLAPVDLFCDSLENVDQGSSKPVSVLPACTSPYAWRECILADILDQIHKLRQLEILLLTADNHSSSASVTSPGPESLLYRLVYPLSKFTLQRLDEYYERGFLGSFEGGSQQRHQQQQQSHQHHQQHHQQDQLQLYIPPPPLRGGILSFSQYERQINHHHHHHHHHRHHYAHQVQQQRFNEMERLRRSGLGQFERFSVLTRMGRFRRRETAADESGDGTNDGNNNNSNNNNSSINTNNGNGNGNSSLTQRQGHMSSRGQREHAITLELPHVSTILQQQEELQRSATPSFLGVSSGRSFYAVNPTLTKGSCFVWQPMFQTTMCYCPVTHQRCLDASVCGIEQTGSPESPIELNGRPGVNPAQLLTCGHILSNRAIVAMLERVRHQAAPAGMSVRCVYCPGETMLEDLVVLFYIY